jgi:hypothetical protein
MDMKAFRAAALKELRPLADAVAKARARVNDLEAGLVVEAATAAAALAVLENPATLGSADSLRIATARLEDHRETVRMLRETLIPNARTELATAHRACSDRARDVFDNAQKQCYVDVRKALDTANAVTDDFLRAVNDVARELAPDVDAATLAPMRRW